MRAKLFHFFQLFYLKKLIIKQSDTRSKENSLKYETLNKLALCECECVSVSQCVCVCVNSQLYVCANFALHELIKVP